MKKGCLIALLIVGVLLGIGIWKIAPIFKQALQFAQEMAVIAEDFKQQTDQLNRDYPFTESAEITFTDQQMQTFMAVRRQLNDSISTSPFLQKMKEFKQMEEGGSDPSISDIVELLSNITPSIKQVGSVFLITCESSRYHPINITIPLRWLLASSPVSWTRATLGMKSPKISASISAK